MILSVVFAGFHVAADHVESQRPSEVFRFLYACFRHDVSFQTLYSPSYFLILLSSRILW